jgi:hypothetical protein
MLRVLLVVVLIVRNELQNQKKLAVQNAVTVLRKSKDQKKLSVLREWRGRKGWKDQKRLIDLAVQRDHHAQVEAEVVDSSALLL